MPTTSTTSLKLDLEIKDRVQRLAAVRRRSAHWVMREADEQYVVSLYRHNVAKLSLARALGDGQDYRKYLGGK